MESELERVFGLLHEHGFVGFAGLDEYSGSLKIGAPHFFSVFDPAGKRVGSIVYAVRPA